MDQQSAYILSQIPKEGVGEEQLKSKVLKDIEGGIGPFSGYARTSYGKNKFHETVQQLVEKEYIIKEGKQIKLTEIARKLLELERSATAETVEDRLYTYHNDGCALKLLILRLILENKDRENVIAQLEKDGWSKRAIELTFSDLTSKGFLSSEYPIKASKEMLPKVEEWLHRYKTDIIKFSASKVKESELLQSQQPPKVGIKELDDENIRSLLFEIIEQCRTNKVEILDADLEKIRLILNQKSYEVRYIEKLDNVPYFDTDYAVFLCRSFGPYFFKDYCSETSSEKRKVCAIFNLHEGHRISYVQNYLFNMIQQTIENKFYGSKFVCPLDPINEEFTTLFIQKDETLQKERERLQELEKEKVLDQGFVYTEPNLPWSLTLKIPELLSKGSSCIRICNPYLDNSTFSFLQMVKDYSKVQILTTVEERFFSKVKSKKITRPEIEKIITQKQVEIKSIPDLHSRFIVIDDQYALFLSTDLQIISLNKKYQYGSWSNDSQIVKNSIDYFDRMWKDAAPFDVLNEIKKAEKA